jgi:hypothetical protein
MEKNSDYNTAFFQKTVPHLHLLECGNYNLFKVVQDALLRKIGGNKSGYFRNKISISSAFLKIIFRIKQQKIISQVNQFRFPESGTLCISPARVVKGKHVYLENVLKEIQRENPVVINLLKHQDFSDRGIDADKIKQIFGSLVPDEVSLKLKKNLYATFQNIKKQKIFSEKELTYILSGFNEFWWNASLWMRFLKINNFSAVYLIPGYQTESIIYACRESGVKVAELQHGIISQSSSFFLYPPFMQKIASRALFPDKIFVFGPYWKNLLLKGHEFSSSQIEIIGDYFFKRKDSFKTNLPHGKKLIVFAGQKPVSASFQKEYLLFLRDDIRKRNLNYIIVHKPHPLEELSLYSDLYNEIIMLSDDSVSSLIPQSDIFISMFSTTLYEAREKGGKTFALYYPGYSEMINDVINNKIALKLLPGQNPVDLNQEQEKFPEGFLFSEFSKTTLKANF